MSICVMSSCATSIFVMSICAMSSCVMSVCVCVMSICVVSVCVMSICVRSYPKRNLHTARRQTRMPARHPDKIFAPPIGTATPNAIYTQQGAFFPASAYWPVWPGQLTGLIQKKEKEAVQVHLIGAEPIVQVRT